MISFEYRFPDKPIETTPNVVTRMPSKLWMAQAKYEGWRLETYCDRPGHVRCLSSRGRSMEQNKSGFRLSNLFEKMKLPRQTVIDAEYIGPRGRQEPSIYIFDMLAWDGEWLTREPYDQRWERCKALKLPKGPIHLAETVEDDFIAFFERLKAEWDQRSINLHEGIVIKSRKGKLKLSRNGIQKTDAMYKLKYREIREKKW